VKKSSEKILGGKELVDKIVKSAKDKLAENIVVLDIQGLPGTADWFIICESDNAVHNKAIADAIVRDLNEQGTRAWHEEGTEDGRWILIDYSDVVVHIMLPELRSFYNLEELWAAGKKIPL